mgnify:CR=1 FL=1
MKKYVLALDQGTTSSRAILFDKNGNICYKAQHEFNQIYPHTGWVEHNPMTIWSTQIAACTEALLKIGANWEEVYVPSEGDPFTVEFELNGGIINNDITNIKHYGLDYKTCKIDVFVKTIAFNNHIDEYYQNVVLLYKMHYYGKPCHNYAQK